MKKVEYKDLVAGKIYLRKAFNRRTIFMFKVHKDDRVSRDKVLYTNESHLMHRGSEFFTLALRDYGTLFELEENEIPIVILEEIE